MRILILEDNKFRIEAFRTHLIGTTKDFCTEASDAIHLLKTNKYDLIMLDHDLGGEVYVDSNEANTGYQVAKTIPDSINKDTRIIVHSMNPIGAKLMVDTIGSNAKHVPFCCLNFEDVK